MIEVKSHKTKSTQVAVTCGHCSEEFSAYACYVNRGQYKYCSRDCVDSARTGIKRVLSEKGRQNIVESNKRMKTGITLTEEHKRKASESLKRISHLTHSDEWKEKMSIIMKGRKLGPLPEATRLQMGLSRTGAKNPNWKGGITDANKAFRTSTPYKEWRKAVFTRDGFTCQNCSQVGGELHADHIQPFAYFPDLRLAVDNGRTLCKPCHAAIGWKYTGGAVKVINSLPTV